MHLSRNIAQVKISRLEKIFWPDKPQAASSETSFNRPQEYMYWLVQLISEQQEIIY